MANTNAKTPRFRRSVNEPLGSFQCDQIGWFLKVLGDKFSWKSGQNIWWLFGPFSNFHFHIKTAVPIFWATLLKFSATFYSNIWSHWLLPTHIGDWPKAQALLPGMDHQFLITSMRILLFLLTSTALVCWNQAKAVNELLTTYLHLHLVQCYCSWHDSRTNLH